VKEESIRLLSHEFLDRFSDHFQDKQIPVHESLMIQCCVSPKFHLDAKKSSFDVGYAAPFV